MPVFFGQPLGEGINGCGVRDVQGMVDHGNAWGTSTKREHTQDMSGQASSSGSLWVMRAPRCSPLSFSWAAAALPNSAVAQAHSAQCECGYSQT